MVQYKFSSIYITGLCFIYKGTTVLVQWCISSKFSTALYYSCISNLAAADEWCLRLRTIQIIYPFRMIILYASIFNFNFTTLAQRSDRWKTN